MSEYLSCEDFKNKISIVVRKAQEGKTTICIQYILRDTSKNKHIVLTKDTLNASSQFTSRVEGDILPGNIIVFNSNKTTAGECHHAKTKSEVIDLLMTHKNIKVIICCANHTRIKKSLPEIFETLYNQDIPFVIHIDEGHKYIPTPKNNPSFRKYNECSNVTTIIAYTATPDKIWNSDKNDKLFHKILIRDVESELSIVRTKNYFGVKDCEFICFEDKVNHTEIEASIPEKIPPHIIDLANNTKKSNKGKKTKNKEPRDLFYGNDYFMEFGNERLMMGFLLFMLPSLPIDPNSFSYHFVPALPCKVTHYQSMELILHCWLTANVIVSNGEGYQLFRKTDSGENQLVITCDEIIQSAKSLPNKFDRTIELNKLKEPSYMIQRLIEPNHNYPTFITGLICIQESVTLINPDIGNFDSFIMSHPHLSRDDKYQICRFLFNYERWRPEQRVNIKKTKFYSLTRAGIEECLEYEEHNQRVSTEFAGKTVSLQEIQGKKPTAEEIEEEEKQRAFCAIERKDENIWTKIKVYDGNDAIAWKKAEELYYKILKKRISGRSDPRNSETRDGFYECSISKNKDVQLDSILKRITKSNEKWSNRFQLKSDCLSYARVFVGYDNLEDPTEYTIFIKFVELVDTQSTREYLAKYYPVQEATSRKVATAEITET
jgi:hypothetical protein